LFRCNRKSRFTVQCDRSTWLQANHNASWILCRSVSKPRVALVKLCPSSSRCLRIQVQLLRWLRHQTFFLLPPSLVRNGFVEHVPPPPMPFVVNANIGNSLPSISVADSVGSVGHPHSCGKSCKYVRRKTGCTNGSQCLDCHQCQWRRQAAGPPTQMAAEAPFSRGARPKAELADTVKAFNEDQGDTVPSAPSSFPSVGSIGHPFSCCGVGCKFKDKVRGCKDGPFCAYCHLCHWHRGTSLIDRQPGVHHS